MEIDTKLTNLRRAITENLRVQRGGAEAIPYIDVTNVLTDIGARQNHAIFGRRGCGKSLLLHHSARQLPKEIQYVYLNCEDFKKHSFPNVLIQILDALFAELQTHLTGWFGRKKKSRDIIKTIRTQLAELMPKADKQEQEIRESEAKERGSSAGASAKVASGPASLKAEASESDAYRAEIERRYRQLDEKIRDLDMWLPDLKARIREFFNLSTTVKTIFLQIDDYYHIARSDQPYVMDYLHRLCKDLPLYFKLGTLRHASVLYADRHGQPIGAQERHDYQPINIDFTLSDLRRTEEQNRRILHEFGRIAGMTGDEIDSLFKGEGFSRLVLAGGGVPRDCLSLFLEILDAVRSNGGDGRIGKDDVRILSRSNFERRIEELKQDSEGTEQNTLIHGIYVLRRFCIEKKTNVFMISEQMMQQEDRVRDLVYRLLDYRIIHNAGSALTHKSQPGTYQASAIDIGCYAHMRKLHGRFSELDLSYRDAKERMRSAPILDIQEFEQLWRAAPEDVESALRAEDGEED
jgi:energy-coupling factor transporter ATP-binding protein EcfA2